MQTLRKKTSPLKFKNETTRFLGDGVSFKAKLIGILEVSEARGDRMCQEALCDLKMAIRAAGEHKQRITVNIAIDGLRLRDEKTGDCLYHHPVHKISFIAQDMTDSRAFGYIFGSPDTGHRFFGIKTDKAASQVVIAMRDLFQVVFALKKKEIELAKQHLEKSYIPTSPLFSESPPTSATKPSEKPKNEAKSSCGAGSLESKSGGTAVADLVDLELELNSLQQGLNQMERITPSDPFGSKDDPFGDSFTSYPVNKLILPPPPSSGRDRSSRTSEGSNSTKTPPNTGASIDSASDSTLFSAKTNKEFSFSSKDFNSSHEEPSSGDWFNPSFGNSIFEETVAPSSDVAAKDEKHEAAKQEIMSQFDVFTELDPLELKNPPKKALNELVVSSGTTAVTSSATPDLFFNQSQTAKMQNNALYSNSVASTNVFTSDPFGEDPFVKEDPFADSDFSKQDPFETEFATRELQAILQSGSNNNNNNLYRSPLMAPVLGASPKTVQFGAQKEPESAPEPPPRPVMSLGGIQPPPPLPPKKQSDIVLKPPPRPPHLEDARYDYLENIEREPKSAIDHHPPGGVGDGGAEDNSPPLPLPQRKTTRFDTDFGGVAPERPRKQNQLSSDEDYLTPISFPERSNSPSGVLLPPPPQRQAKKDQQVLEESGPDSLEGLDMTLSQLTLSGLNELAAKLKIPPHKLSNMTLVQLTNYLSTFIKTQQQQRVKNGTGEKFPAFRADFASNFGNDADAVVKPPPATAAAVIDPPTYDRYAVFRELQEEIKQTRIDTEPEEIQEKDLDEPEPGHVTTVSANGSNDDKYAALREIVDIEIKRSVTPKEAPDEEEVEQDKNVVEVVTFGSANLANDKEQSADVNPQASIDMSKANIIEYMAEPSKEGKATIIVAPTATPEKSPVLKSPVPSAVTEIIQTSARMTSGSLSDVLSGSSPEVDNTGSNSDIPKKVLDPAGDSWAIFDQPTVLPSEIKENLATTHSEEGVSPWSSDSKEFGNRSPTDWKKRETKQSERRKKHRDQEGGWWDTSADPEGPYYPGNRRSTDSYEDEYYECYDRPRRRRPPGGQQFSSAGGGGHSSSSRDVSPWEEEQPRRRGDGRSGWGRHSRGHSFERHRDLKHTDSWDDEDDYDYGDEHRSRSHYFQRHGSKDSERHSSAGSRDMDSDRWDDYGQERGNRYRRRRDSGRADVKELKEGRRCCPDWEQSEHDKSGRYSSRRGTSVSERRDRYDERYRSSRESQDSPWEDEYANEPEEPPPPPPPPHSPHYLPPKKRDNWKQRPSSASEMDRKTVEIKSRHHIGTGGSDGERDRRYKASRRSRSRDSSQFNEPPPPPPPSSSSSAASSRHKPDSGSMRGPHRLKSHKAPELDYAIEKKIPPNDATETGGGTKKLLTTSLSLSAANRRKLGKDTKNEPASVAIATTANTLPRKGISAARSKSMFDHNYGGGSDDSPIIREGGGSKFSFENDDFDKVEAQSSAVNRPIKGLKQHSLFDKTQLRLEKSFKDRRGESFQESKLSPRFQTKPRSPFEDDFSPSDKTDAVPEGNGISCIKEEPDTVEEDEEDSFGTSSQNVRATTTAHERRRALNKSRLSSGRNDVNLKKSGSVNIFARESDPFDDDFFSGAAGMGNRERVPRRSTELKWTDDFEDSDNGRK